MKFFLLFFQSPLRKQKNRGRRKGGAWWSTSPELRYGTHNRPSARLSLQSSVLSPPPLGSLVVDLTRGKVGNTEWTECLAFSLVVRIGSSTPHPQENVAPSPFWDQGGTHSLAGEGAGEPIQTMGQTLRSSRHSIVLSLHGRELQAPYLVL